ncbi:MAG TPA: methyl-accepting chemotaxis protein, partial [Labilithrix sp.]|nr:methyl-accepting chemotaxis protein [Labilithrix sp.]
FLVPIGGQLGFEHEASLPRIGRGAYAPVFAGRMNNLSNRQVLAFIAVVVAAAAAYVLVKDKDANVAMQAAAAVLALGLLAVFLAGGGGPTQDLGSVLDGIRRARRGDRPSPPVGASPELARVFDDLGRFAEEEERRARDAKETQEQVESLTRKLQEGVQLQVSTVDETTRLVKDISSAMRAFSSSVEALTQNAEESSSSILEMTATSNEVADNLGELSNNVRETVGSIEEMAYSIKEVAKNVDALSLTAEETSSSMNEMDISIDQVQSNANETARLSEEVSFDAEKGAEAILKTISEIYRIKESSQDAVAAISALGSRIDAIGQIVNVIDEVAEQTNLLALNAAIIAAQAGEQGKGFAVVADEIKDLAERAGASTREITDLIKTVQNESKNAITAVERGAHNVDRGVEVSNEAERALKKILESSTKSTNMVRAIARATVEQAKGSKQVTDTIGRIAETVQQIAAATAQQARGAELIMKSADKMRLITQHVERSANEQAKGGRQITSAIENISGMVTELDNGHKSQSDGARQLAAMITRIEETARAQEAALRQLTSALGNLRIR